MRISFQEELERLESALQDEGELVIRSLRACLGALEHDDAELADEVISFDDDVDEKYFAVQEAIHALLARQTPVAVDLRLVLAILHINLHLERMADYCVTIAKLTKLVSGLKPDRALVELDELIDRANRRVVENVLALGSDPDQREWGLRMIIVSRCLERIGDHAVDVGEQTAYLVTGEFREFTDASHPEMRPG